MSQYSKRSSIYFSLAAVAASLSACAPQKSEQPNQESANHQTAENSAPRDMKQSFSSLSRAEVTGERLDGLASTSSLRPEAAEYLVIKKDAIGKDFLMSASLIPQNESPTSSGLQGRVVAFKKIGRRLFLVESTEGHVISPTLPAALILAEIPIIEDRNDEVVIDFNAGMNKIFMAGNWWASDFDGTVYDASNQGFSLPVEVSYLDSIKNHGAENEILEIRQIAQAVMPFGIMRPTIEVRYYLQAYQTNPNYKARESNSNFDHVGYFQTPPSLERTSGRSKIYNTLFDTTKPVTFYVSGNTPPEYQDAVKEGILYWNKAFGKEVVRAQIAPEGVTAPDPTRNLVQWVEFDNAGFAYADALMDPRNGEIKHAQVYLTSAFAFGSKIRARQLLRLLGAEQVKAEETVKDDKKHVHRHKMYAPFSIKGLRPEALCDYDKSESILNLIQSLEAVEAEGIEVTDAAVLRISQDYIREVTAHEIGHTLGLRHNFAGNLASTYSQKERADAMKTYIQRSQLENVDASMTTSSVMEYTDFVDAVLSGALMKARKAGLPYDIKAIKYAYEDEKLNLEDGVLFCTDSHADKFLDCTRFDSGANSLEFAAASIQDKLAREAYRFTEAFLTAKSHVVAVNRLPVQKVSVNPATAAAIGVSTASSLSWLGAAKRSIRVERSFTRLDALNQEDLLIARLKDLQELIKNVGGKAGPAMLAAFNLEAFGADEAELKANAYTLPADFTVDFVKKVSDYLERPDVKNFVGMDGQKYELTTAEADHIKEYAAKYAKKFSEVALQSSLKAIAAAKLDLEVEALKYKLPTENLTEALEKKIAAISASVIKAVGGGETIKYKTANFVVPKFKYTQEERLAAARALSAKQAPLPEWNEAPRKALKTFLTNSLSQALNVEDLWKLEASTYSGNRAFQLWLQNHAAVQGAL